MRKFATLSALALLTTPFAAHAAPAGGYHCVVMMLTDKSTIEESFDINAKTAPSHGGTALTFRKDDYIMTVSADGKWLNMQWEKAGKTIAAGQFVTANDSETPRVALMFNPANFEEQASLNCEPKAETSTSIR